MILWILLLLSKKLLTKSTGISTLKWKLNTNFVLIRMQALLEEGVPKELTWVFQHIPMVSKGIDLRGTPVIKLCIKPLPVLLFKNPGKLVLTLSLCISQPGNWSQGDVGDMCIKPCQFSLRRRRTHAQATLNIYVFSDISQWSSQGLMPQGMLVIYALNHTCSPLQETKRAGLQAVFVQWIHERSYVWTAEKDMNSHLSPQFKFMIFHIFFTFFTFYGYIVQTHNVTSSQRAWQPSWKSTAPVSQRSWVRISFRPEFFSGFHFSTA